MYMKILWFFLMVKKENIKWLMEPKTFWKTDDLRGAQPFRSPPYSVKQWKLLFKHLSDK